MKTRRLRASGPEKPRLLLVPETEPYGPEHVDVTGRTQPYVREERPQDKPPESAGRYSHVYGRRASNRPPRGR